MKEKAELTVTHELQAAMSEPLLVSDDEAKELRAPQWVLRSTLAALDDGRVSEAVEQFDDTFKFNDHGLALEFSDKPRLTQFFQKCWELFPDSALEVISLTESGSHAIAEWRLAATQTMPLGSLAYQIPIGLYGSTIVRVENGKIVQWSDYYDKSTSRRFSLADYFTEWIEY